ncbi:MAG: carboxypeptidase Q [Planctomycetota bacterium]|jgi:carboxypeptidase Q
MASNRVLSRWTRSFTLCLPLISASCNDAARSRDLKAQHALLEAQAAAQDAQVHAGPTAETLTLRPEWVQAIDRITQESLARGLTFERLTELCTRAPHRLAGSDDAARAVEWARDTMLADGFENVHIEACRIPHWVRGDIEELTALEPRELAGQTLPVVALGGSIATAPDGVEGEVIVVESFDELEQIGIAGARDKIVLFNRPMDDASLDTFSAYGGAVNQRSGGASAAAKVGAVAALVRSMTTLRDDVPHTGTMSYSDEVGKIPTAAISTNAADRLAAMIKSGKQVKLRLRLDCRSLGEADSGNVVGELRGRELPDEIVLVSGHLDGWDVGQGAHDDGAGSCHALETLRLLKVLDLVPRRTVRLVLYMNEENGTAGARAYAKDHEGELALHVAAFESDRGGFTPRGFSADVEDSALLELRGLARYLEPLGAAGLRAGSAGADISFLKSGGVPLIGLLPDSQRYFDYHHSANDTLEAVNRRELHLGSAALASMVYLVAERAMPLSRKSR